MLVATWISAISSAGLLVGAVITAIFAIKAFGAQAQQVGLVQQQVKDKIDSDDAARTIWQWEYGSAIVAWLEEPSPPLKGQVLLTGFVENTGVRPVRDVSLRWYLGQSAITDEQKLAACFMPVQERPSVPTSIPSISQPSMTSRSMPSCNSGQSVMTGGAQEPTAV